MARPGFTLIELLLVAAILAVLGAVVSPFLFGQKTGIEIEEEAAKISNVLKNARTRSVSMEQGASWGVYFYNTSTPYYDFFSGSDYPSGQVAEKFYLNESSEFEAPVVGASTTVIFGKRTGSLSGGATTTIIVKSAAQAGQQKTIIISPNGLINVE